MKKINITFMIVAFIATAGIVSAAFAHGGWGSNGFGGHMMGSGAGYGMGPGMMGYNGYGMGPGMMGYGYGRGDDSANLSRADGNRLHQAQDKFYDETRTLRNQIRDKQYALNDELDSTNPDKAKVAELQKALSRLQSEYDQKAIAYRLELRDILPEIANHRGYGNGPGYGGCNW